jgi:hypothetical protein
MSHNESFYMPEVDAYVQYAYIFWDAIDCIAWSRFHTERLRWDISNRILSIGGQQYEMPYSEKYFREKQMYDYKIATYKGAVVAILRAVTPSQLDYLWEPDQADMMGFEEVPIRSHEIWARETHFFSWHGLRYRVWSDMLGTQPAEDPGLWYPSGVPTTMVG